MNLPTSRSVKGFQMAAKLYRCKTPTDRLCPCGKVHRELVKAGVECEVVRVPLSAKPAHREEIVAMTGQPKVPVLVTDDGTAIHDSKRIIEHIRSGALDNAG